MKNRLQFRHHSPIFEDREAALDFITEKIRNSSSGMVRFDSSQAFSVFAEPTILRYKNVTDDDPTGEDDPHIIIAIGSKTAEGLHDSKYCIIDIDNTEKEIEDLREEIEKLIAGLAIIPQETDTLKLYAERTDDGTFISGDVKVAESYIFDDYVRRNSIIATEDGIFTFVKMQYNEGDDKFTFIVNGDVTEVPLYEYYITAGWYNKRDESLHLKRKDGNEIVISLEDVLGEWTVNNDNTPVVLTKEDILYGNEQQHSHTEPWQSVLKGDIRIDQGREHNILKKSIDGSCLYVDGLANNIKCYKNGQVITVQDALDEATKNASNDSTNIIYEKIDGFYATAKLKYNNRENKLIFTTSNVTGGTTVEEFQLVSFDGFSNFVYDPITEELIIFWKDSDGNEHTTKIPLSGMISEWDVLNEGHNVELHKKRNIDGKDKLSADAKIYDDPDNILVDKNHELFVKGTADNIRYGRDGNVSDELDKLNANDSLINSKIVEVSGKVGTLRTEFDREVERSTSEDERLNEKLNNEIERSTDKDREIENEIAIIDQKIGTGFTTDGHETITYKFNELSSKTDVLEAETDANTANITLLSTKIENEIARAESEEQRIEKKFDDELGEGFDVRNTVRDEIDREKEIREATDNDLQDQINAIDDKIDARCREVVNEDHSIIVDKSESGKSIVSVNLSDEVIDGLKNVIKLNNDGLYAGVDLDYQYESGTSKNVLIFKTTNGTKVFDLKNHSVIDKIYYDPIREAIIIEYTIDGKRMPDVVVPVGELANQWRVSEDTNGAIKLTLTKAISGTTDKDVLSAETIISNHEDNILINDNGALYVSGAQIEANRNSISDLLYELREEVSRATAEENSLNEKIQTEKERAINAEDSLLNEIQREIERARTKEGNIEVALSSETIARISGDTAINTKIDNEIERSTRKDEEHDNAIQNLNTRLENEITRSTIEDSSIRSALSAETNARISGDIALNTKIESAYTIVYSEINRIERNLNDEIVRSNSKDEEHDTKISQLINELNNEIDRAQDEETRIENRLEREITRASGAEVTLKSDLEREIARSTDKDSEHDTRISELSSDIVNEVTNRTNADNELRNLIHQEEDRAKDVESAITIALNIESITRQNSDAIINDRIDRETESRISGDTILDSKIETERTRATTEEHRIENSLNNKIDDEINRSTTEDTRLNNAITAETLERTIADDDIREEIVDERARATISENTISNNLNTEIERAKGAESALTLLIASEKDAREAEDEHIWRVIRPIEFIDTSTIHNERVRNDGSNPDEVRHSVIIAQADDNIIIANDTLGGLYATAKLGYNESANLLTIYGPDDKVLNSVTLGPGSLIKDISYDYAEKTLVVTYRRAGDSEDTTMNFPVADLFNEWDIQNPSEKSAIELHKVNQSGETGNVDILWGRVLITDDRNGDGKPDEGSDNLIEIRNNGLYVGGEGIEGAKEEAECAINELRIVETAVLGEDLSGGYDCGNGYRYQTYRNGCFISAATSMYNADVILDRNLCIAFTEINEIKEDVDCLTTETDVIENNVLGVNVPPCGLNNDGTTFDYPVNRASCFISAATSMYNADVILDRELCNVKTDVECMKNETSSVEKVLGISGHCSDIINYPKTTGCLLSSASTYAEADAILEENVCKLIEEGGNIEGSERPTTTTSIEDNPTGDGKVTIVDVRLSHGNSNSQSDTELIISDLGDSGFTDTNALSIVDINGYLPDSKYNGLYLSNILDCGMYTLNGEGTPGNKYRIDESSTAANYYDRLYRNGVRA